MVVVVQHQPSEESSEEARERERRLLEKRSRWWLSSLLLLFPLLKVWLLRWWLRDPNRDSLPFLPLIMLMKIYSTTTQQVIQSSKSGCIAICSDHSMLRFRSACLVIFLFLMSMSHSLIIICFLFLFFRLWRWECQKQIKIMGEWSEIER